MKVFGLPYARHDKSIKCSVIESQLWLKMFIVTPSLMKEDMFLLFLLFCVSNLDPHQCQVQ